MHIEDYLKQIDSKLDQLLKIGHFSGAAPAVEVETDPEPVVETKKRAIKGAKAAKEKPLSTDDLRAVCVEIAKSDSEGKEKIVAALQRHGASRLNDVPENMYPDMMAMLIKIRDDGMDPRDAVPDENEDEAF